MSDEPARREAEAAAIHHAAMLGLSTVETAAGVCLVVLGGTLAALGLAQAWFHAKAANRHRADSRDPTPQKE